MTTDPRDAAYKEGRRLIDEHMRQRAHLSSYDLFRSCWKLIEDNADKFKGRAALGGFPEGVWRILVHHDFVRHFSQHRPGFLPPVRDLRVPKAGAVMVSVHTGLELGVARALTEKGKPVSLVYSPSPQNRLRSQIYKPDSKTQFIRADEDCLLNAAIALRGGGVLLADCDHPLPEDPTASSVRALKRPLFDLARVTRSELCFVLPFVDRRGHIDFVAKTLGIPDRGSGDLRPDFVAFLRECGMTWIEWRFE